MGVSQRGYGWYWKPARTDGTYRTEPYDENILHGCRHDCGAAI